MDIMLIVFFSAMCLLDTDFGQALNINDVKWQSGDMWYWANNSLMGLYDVWRHGYTGNSVSITIIDDGVDSTITDLSSPGKYNALLSYDYLLNNPSASSRFPNSHGTNAATVAAGSWNNSVCGFGAAPDASIIAVRLFSSSSTGTSVTDSRFVAALTGVRNNQARHVYTDVFVTSWGGDDSGTNFVTPGPTVRAAQRTASTDGRHGYGSLHVQATGNGGDKSDNCAGDGYTQGPWVINAQAVMQNGQALNSSESCANSFTSVYVDSGLMASNPSYLTISCDTFGFTSAATPVVAGILALAIQAKPTLSRRDLLNLLVQASEPSSLSPSIVWQTNAAGIQFHDQFGFGLLNASKLVDLALTTVPTRSSDYLECSGIVGRSISTVSVTFDVVQLCANWSTVEFVTIDISVTALVNRGDIEIVLQSPQGTTVQLLTKRPLDIGSAFINLMISTPFFWNESPNGTWTLTASPPTSTLGNVRMNLYMDKLAPIISSTTSPATTSSPLLLKGWEITLIVLGCALFGVGCFVLGRYIYLKKRSNTKIVS